MSWLPALPQKGSLLRRLLSRLTLTLCLLWCLTGALAVAASLHELNETFDGGLRELARQLMPLIEGGRTDLPLQPEDAAPHHHTHRYSFRLIDAGGRQIARQGDAPLELLAAPMAGDFRTIGHYRLFRLQDPASGAVLTVAEALRDRMEAVRSNIFAGLLQLLLLIPLSVAIIWLSVTRALRPVRQMSDEIARRHGSNLSPLGGPAPLAELAPISEAVERLMERLRLALAAERNFAADSAHELRTPVAAALAQVQRLQEISTDPETARRAGEIAATLKRLARLSDNLIQIARVEAGLALDAEPQELLRVLDVLIEDARRMAAAGEILFQPPASGHLRARITPDAFAIVIRNLLDNAVRHGPPGGAIRVDARMPGRIIVSNGGHVLPAELLGGLTARFARGPTRAAGSGLGLAIVGAVLRQSGGGLILHSPAPGGDDGFAAEIILAV
ncbi:HAMP domain-containing histidine kinase [Thioclava sp. BHET1]|nr:HAMP domain-containing histidine kinase [Thioclava sp. BHET1]